MKITKEQLKQIIKEELTETIRKVGGKYAVYPKKGGKRLGTHSTKTGANSQLAAIEISKKQNEAKRPHEPVMEEVDIEVGNIMSTLNKTMKEVADGMKQLDLSIDYLSSIFIGMDPFEVGVQQRAFGRTAAPTAANRTPEK
jgi:hypothetical protein|tara:strand:+ start:1064 stop:1486 length:423 start_codon:yes stop_codon:yes gene_type:complete